VRLCDRYPEMVAVQLILEWRRETLKSAGRLRLQSRADDDRLVTERETLPLSCRRCASLGFMFGVERLVNL